MKKYIVIIMCFLLIMATGCGSNSARGQFERIIYGVKSDEHSTVDIDVTGEITQIIAEGDDVNEITVAINGDDKYLFIIPECSLKNNNDGARDKEGNYITQLPNNIEIGDNIKVTGGEIIYREKDENNIMKYPYIVGFKSLNIFKVK